MTKRLTKYQLEALYEAVANNVSLAGVLKHFDLKLTGGNYRAMRQRIDNYMIDTLHFTGQLWSKGHTADTHPSIMTNREKQRYSDEEVLCVNSPVTSSTRVKTLMLKHNKKYECENGHNALWMGEPLTLHIDHKNGVRHDNRLENLRFLCPNCHQQTDTWGKRK